MRLGALQPGYLPWLGFFDQINRCDVFILYDDLPYTKKTWRNRNRVRTSAGWRWLTVPVVNKGLRRKTIREVEVSEHGNWRRHHWRAIRHHYARAPHFPAHEEFFAKLYERRWTYLVDMNLAIIRYVVEVLGIRTKILISSQVGLEEEYLRTTEGGQDATSRVIFLCRRFGSDCFLEGASGAQFMDPGALETMGLTLEFHNYQHPRYRQLYTPFVPYLSVIDLLFNHGLESLDILIGRKVVWSL